MKEVNIAPVLPVIGTQTIAANSLLTVTQHGDGAEHSCHNNGLRLVGPPAGATISAGGIITWTPANAGHEHDHDRGDEQRQLRSGEPDVDGNEQLHGGGEPVVTNNPPPVIQSTVVSGGNIVLTWSAVSGASYQVQYKHEHPDFKLVEHRAECDRQRHDGFADQRNRNRTAAVLPDRAPAVRQMK